MPCRMADCNHPSLANCDLIRFALPSSLLCGNRLGDDRRPPNDVIAIAMTPRFFWDYRERPFAKGVFFILHTNCFERVR